MQLTFSIPQWNEVWCKYCSQYREWDGGKGWDYFRCPDCKKEYNRRYYAANTDAIREQTRRYRAANSDAIRERNRQYRAANGDARRERDRERYADNRDVILQRNRRFRAANPDKVREYKRRERAANPDAVRGRLRRWRAANPEAQRNLGRKHSRNRRARKTNAVCAHGPGCFADAVAQLPQCCAVPGCRKRKGLEADHIIPLAGGGLDCKDNLQLLCLVHNRSKGAADPTAWAQRNGRLL